MFRPLSACLAVLVLLGVMPVQAQQTAYTGLVCRGVEESGRLIIGQPGFGPHLISIFATGPNPLSASQTIAQHVAWVTDPLHSYVPDGFGAMCIWAHPDGQKPETLLALPGLSGFELSYCGWGAKYDALADGVWRACVAAQRPFLWGYAADDTHASGAKGLSWFAARLPERTEKALKHALRTGAFYVSNGPTIANITAPNESLTVTLDQPGDVCWLRDGQFLTADKDEPIPVQVAAEAGANRCLQMDRGVTASTLTLSKLAVPRAQLQFVRAIVGTQPTRMAQTQPFRLLPDGQIANPYPSTGDWVRGQTHNHSDTPPWSNVGLQRFRLGYQEKGEAASFCTDYSYWESPYQWAPEEGTPQVLAVQPSRLAARASQPVTITGLNFGEAPRVQFGAQAAQVLEHAPDRLRVALPAGLAPGEYDVVVDNERFRGTLALGFAVQKPDADTRGWTGATSADGLCYDRCVAIACRGSEVWVGTMNGLGILRDGQWRTVTSEMGARSVYAMAADPDGSVWVATERGLAHCDVSGAWKAETVGQVEKVDKNRATERWGRMIFDGQGTLWTINRWSAGLGVRRDGQWQRLTAAADGIPTNAPNTIARDKSGTVWLGYGGLARLVNGTWEKLAIPAEAGGTTVAALAPLADGAMLAAINSDPDKGALVVFRDGKGEVMSLSETRLPSPRVRDALAARSGDIWIATDYGVTRWDGRSQWRHYDTLNSGLGCNIVLGLAEDGQGRIWMATAQGVSSFAP